MYTQIYFNCRMSNEHFVYFGFHGINTREEHMTMNINRIGRYENAVHVCVKICHRWLYLCICLCQFNLAYCLLSLSIIQAAKLNLPIFCRLCSFHASWFKIHFYDAETQKRTNNTLITFAVHNGRRYRQYIAYLFISLEAKISRMEWH